MNKSIKKVSIILFIILVTLFTTCTNIFAADYFDDQLASIAARSLTDDEFFNMKDLVGKKVYLGHNGDHYSHKAEYCIQWDSSYRGIGGASLRNAPIRNVIDLTEDDVVTIYGENNVVNSYTSNDNNDLVRLIKVMAYHAYHSLTNNETLGRKSQYPHKIALTQTFMDGLGILRGKISDAIGDTHSGTLTPGNHDAYSKHYRARFLLIDAGGSNGYGASQDQIIFGAREQTITYGNLEITKVDKDDESKKLSNVEFYIQNLAGQYVQATKNDTEYIASNYVKAKDIATKFVTGTDGKITIKNLISGKYNVIEANNPNLGYEDNKGLTKETTVTKDTTANLKIENKLMVGNLNIIKTKSDKTPLKIKGIKFQITNKNGEYVIADKSGNDYVATGYGANGTTFETDDEGKISIKNLIIGNYLVKEIENPDSHYEKMDNEVPIVIEVDKTKDLEYMNKQINIDLSGYVWVDETIDEGKINDRNNLKSTNKHPEISNYVDGKDFLLPDIPVKLMRKGQTTPIATQRTNNDGAYKFTNIPLYDAADTEKKNVILDQYYIEFEYNGLVFTNVLPYNDNKVKPYLDSEESNGSKASEAQEVRDNFNKDFSVIEGGTSKDTGITRDSNGNKKYDLTYSADISNHTSEIVTDKDQFPITANTTNTGYNIKDYYKEGITEIKYINLGLYKREKPDISLMKDLQNVKVSINGYNHIYEKGLKRADNQNGEEFNITAKFGNKYGKTKYKQAIYREDYNYKDEANADNNLKVYAIYKIDLMNENTDLQVEVNSIVDYFDSKYSIDKIGTELNNGEVKDNNLSLEGNETTYNDQYKKAIINTKSIGRLDNTTPTRTIYVQYELNKEKILDLFKDKTELEYENVAEINSYSVFKDNKVYAGIDKDSNPGSMTPEDNDTKASYQDDTDWAPGLVLQIASSRTMAGKVFVDDVIKQDGYNDSSATMIGKERIGNGIYDNGEAGVPGVKVTLTSDKMTYISESVNEKAKYKVTTTYHKGSETGDVISEDEIKKNGVPEGSVAIVKYEKTEGNDGIELDVGEYIISEFIPGNYTLTYTWGDKTYTVQDYKGTIYNSSRDQNDVSWYKKDVDTRYSDAIDNYNTNQDAPKGSRIQIDEDANNGITDRTKMDSTTPKMDITIEITDTATTTYNDSFVPKDYNIKNIDFGIVERPRQKLDIDKRIKAFKVILGNEESGQVIVDATVEPKKDVLGNIQRDANGDIIYEITGQKNYTTYMYPSQFTNPTKGQLKLELDSELMQNSIVKVEYEIVVANNSELEYKTEGYYKYGTDKTNIVNIKPSGVYDYMDNTLALDKQHESENSNWEIVATKYDETTDLGPESIVEKYFIDNYSYVDENENQVSVSKWELSSKRYQELYTNWIESIQEKKVDADQIRQIKLNNKMILHNSNLEKELAPGESSTAQLYASKSLANMDEIVLNNDAEITQTRSSSNYGRKITPIDSYLYDSGEEIIIIPPTGESKNYLPYAIIGVTALAILGVGVILIKKKAIGNDGKED